MFLFGNFCSLRVKFYKSYHMFTLVMNEEKTEVSFRGQVRAQVMKEIESDWSLHSYSYLDVVLPYGAHVFAYFFL